MFQSKRTVFSKAIDYNCDGRQLWMAFIAVMECNYYVGGDDPFQGQLQIVTEIIRNIDHVLLTWNCFHPVKIFKL